MRNVATELNKLYKIPLNSFVLAVQNFHARDITSQYELDTMLLDVLGKPIVTANLRELQVMAGYIVQEAVRFHVQGIPAEPDMVIEQATSRTKAYFQTHPWDKAKEVIEHGEVTTDFIPDRKHRAPRGSGMSKKDRAIALYSHHREKSRQELIKLFVDELGLTPPGASTYVHNVQKGLWK